MLLAFAALGRSNHGEDVLSGALGTALPFLLGEYRAHCTVLHYDQSIPSLCRMLLILLCHVCLPRVDDAVAACS